MNYDYANASHILQTYVVSKFRLEGSGPGGIRSALYQSAKRRQGTRVVLQRKLVRYNVQILYRLVPGLPCRTEQTGDEEDTPPRTYFEAFFLHDGDGANAE